MASIIACLFLPLSWSTVVLHMQARRKLSKGGAAVGGDVRGRARSGAAESVARSAKKFCDIFLRR